MRLLALTLLTTITASAQIPLHQRLATIAQEAHGHVYYACSLPGTTLDCDLDPHGHPPMQSTFKFPLAMAVFHQVELGHLQLDQPIRFLRSDRYPTHSPLQDEFADPTKEVDVPLRKLIQLSVQTSDNIASNLELRAIGGPTALQQFLDSLHLAIHQPDSEFTMHGDQHLQYRNFAEPAAMVALLRLFADHSPLTPAHTALLNQWMLASTSGANRMRALLPPGTPLAHRTGSSGDESGVIPATNDVGLITLPNGQRLALAIFVTEAHTNQPTADATIARIARSIYDEAVAKLASSNGAAESASVHISVPNLSLAKGERIVGFEVHVQSGRRASLPHIPIGWNVSVDNDPSWSTSITGTVEVGAAAADADLLHHLIAVEREPDATSDLPFSLQGQVVVTTDFVHERKIALTMKDFATDQEPTTRNQ